MSLSSKHFQSGGKDQHVHVIMLLTLNTSHENHFLLNKAGVRLDLINNLKLKHQHYYYISTLTLISLSSKGSPELTSHECEMSMKFLRCQYLISLCYREFTVAGDQKCDQPRGGMKKQGSEKIGEG